MGSVRPILWAVNIVLLLALSYGAAVAVAALVERSLVKNTPPAPPDRLRKEAPAAREKKPLSDFQAILANNIFGAKRSQPPPVVAAASVATIATLSPAPVQEFLPLNLSLSGTFIMGKHSVAFVIASNTRTERLYRLRDCLPRESEPPPRECGPGQGRVVKIEGESITVELNQKRYLLKLMAGENGFAKGAKGPVSGTPTARRPAIRQTPDGNARPAVEAFAVTQRSKGRQEIHVPAAEVQKAFENFTGILNQARAVPFMVDGKPKGFQMRKIQPGSIFQKLGLLDGDIITAVNGESLTTADQALRLFPLFRNQRNILLEVERKGAALQLSYTIE